MNQRFYVIFVLSCLALLITIDSNAKTYFFSSSMGSDAYTPEQAQNRATPWASIDRANAVMSLLKPGDSLLFKCGDVFSGTLIISASGSKQYPLVFASYGNGEKPVLTGWLTLDHWSEKKPNIWVASNAMLHSMPSALRINQVMVPLGRYPRQDAPHGGLIPMIPLANGQKTRFVDTTLLHQSQNWSGAEAVIRTDRWLSNRIVISQQQGDTLILSKPASNLKPHFGYFIQNHPATLTYDGAWFYNASTHEVWLYSTENPDNEVIQIANQRNNMVIVRQSNIVMDGFKFTGSKDNSVSLIHATGCVIQHCDFDQLGRNAIDFGTYSDLSNDSISILNNRFTQIQSTAVSAFGNHIQISNNQFSKIGLWQGMLNDPGMGINALGNGVTIENNTLDSIGYIPIDFGWSSHVLIQRNMISNFCSVLDDGGGIYCWDGQRHHPIDRVVKQNIIVHGIGAPHGTNDTRRPVEGIYLDDCSSNVMVDQNTIAFCPDAGIFVHDAPDNQLLSNTIFGCGTGLLLVNTPDSKITNSQIEHNIIVSNDSTAHAPLLDVSVIHRSELSQLGSLDHNLYCQPYTNPDYIQFHVSSDGFDHRMDLNTWQHATGFDLHSDTCHIHFPFYSRLLTSYPMVDSKLLLANSIPWVKTDPTGNRSFMKITDGTPPALSFGVIQGMKDSNLSTSVPAMQSGHTYLIRISIRGDSCSQVYFYITNKNQAIVSSWLYPSPVNKTYEFYFKAMENDSNPVMNIVFGPADATKGIIYLNTVQCDEIVPAKFYQRFRLEYNASLLDKTIPLQTGEQIISVNAHWNQQEMTIPPFSSAILVNTRE